jgi:hypothetical protein
MSELQNNLTHLAGSPAHWMFYVLSTYTMTMGLVNRVHRDHKWFDRRSHHDRRSRSVPVESERRSGRERRADGWRQSSRSVRALLGHDRPPGPRGPPLIAS